MRSKKLAALLLAGCMTFSLAACTESTPVSKNYNEEIVLVDPVNSEISYELAEARDLYDATVYTATVLPYIEEYTPENGFVSAGYAAYPGNTVKKGDELIKTNTENMDDQIKDKREYIANMEKDHQKYLEKTQKSVDAYREEAHGWKIYVDINEKEKPEEFILVEDEDNPGEMKKITNPEYTRWKQGYDMVFGKYKIAKHAADTLELQMSQKKAIYELDKKHQEYLLENLIKNRREATLTSKMDGEVVGFARIESGHWVGTDKPVVAVGDRNIRELKCDYINKGTINSAKDVYAVVNGNRVEVEYQAISSEKYLELSANGGKVYTTFHLKDENAEVNIGDFAVIVIINDKREDVVVVPKSAVAKDDMGNYVYLLKDGLPVYTNVKTGMSDGNFVEILQGVEVGDKIVNSSSMTHSDSTVKLERGDFGATFSERGFIEYPEVDSLKNPIKNGTVYFGEMKVEKYSHVDKGDLIATVRVEADSLTLNSNITRLTRLKERFEDFCQKNKDNTQEEYYQDTVSSYREQIGELEKTIAEQQADFQTKEIRADRSGVVVELRNYKAEDVVQYDQWVVKIAQEDTCYVLVEDANSQLQYGNSVKITYKDDEDRSYEAEGMVASVSKGGVDENLQKWGFSFIRVSEEQIAEMLSAIGNSNDPWSRYRYDVTAQIRSMKNVVLVPKRAVYEMGRKTYVYVKDSQGNVGLKAFVAGGNNDQYYWVIEGLTEGMEVCLK